MKDLHVYAALTEARRGSAWLWPDGVTLDTFHAADSLQEGVTERGRQVGYSPYFGETTAIYALHALAVWIERLPADKRDAVLTWVRRVK